jgi:hypothetical protein
MEYDINKIRVLCGRYFDGDITEDEEMTLKSWFLNTEEVPSDLKPVKAMFRGFEEAAAMRYRTFGRIFWGTVAAAAAAAVCIGIFNREIYGYDADGKAITDPQVAMESTSYLSYLDNLETSIDIAMMLTMEMETTTDK